MNKVQVQLGEKEWKHLDKWGFDVKPFISTIDEQAIIQVYIQDLFNENGKIEENYIKAERGLTANLLELNTNLLLVSDDGNGNQEIVVPLDKIYEHYDLYQAVENSIINIGDFKRKLLKTVEMKREEMRLKNSLGFALEDLYNKVASFLENIAKNGFSEEDAKRVKETIGEIEKSEVLKSLAGKVT